MRLRLSPSPQAAHSTKEDVSPLHFEPASMTTSQCPSDAWSPLVAMTTVTNDDEAMGLPEHLRALYLTTVREGDIDPSNLTELKSLLLHHQETLQSRQQT